ncbi:hypothetical protein MMC06_004746, partial [Schaereria dolodes]|nr:hypothetical protein [Schaereria dolodes]
MNHGPSRWSIPRLLQDVSVDGFREQAFTPSIPTLLSQKSFTELSALKKWFMPYDRNDKYQALNYSYLDRFEHATVPLEFTRLPAATDVPETFDDTFVRSEAPLAVFLRWSKQATVDTFDRLYLAQASISALPKDLIADLPTPEYVSKAGKGDVYDTNLWIGVSPTYTPLHRDPNPNLFVQLAGTKVVRLLSPESGSQVFAKVQAALGRDGSSKYRGEDMMKGKEKKLLESLIWTDTDKSGESGACGLEARLERGEGIFIPKGWWHSIKGVGEGITGS